MWRLAMERVRVSRYLYFRYRNTKQICEGEAARLFIDPFAVQESESCNDVLW